MQGEVEEVGAREAGEPSGGRSDRAESEKALEAGPPSPFRPRVVVDVPRNSPRLLWRESFRAEGCSVE